MKQTFLLLPEGKAWWERHDGGTPLMGRAGPGWVERDRRWREMKDRESWWVGKIGRLMAGFDVKSGPVALGKWESTALEERGDEESVDRGQNKRWHSSMMANSKQKKQFKEFTQMSEYQRSRECELIWDYSPKKIQLLEPEINRRAAYATTGHFQTCTGN